MFFAPAAVTGDAAVVRGGAGLLLAAVLEVADDGGFEGEVRFSRVFASATCERPGTVKSQYFTESLAKRLPTKSLR